jgi:hypothetical protein
LVKDSDTIAKQLNKMEKIDLKRGLVMKKHLPPPVALVAWLSVSEFTKRPMAWRHADFTH